VGGLDLSTWHALVENDGSQPSTGAVDGGGQTSRAGAHYHQIELARHAAPSKSGQHGLDSLFDFAALDVAGQPGCPLPCRPCKIATWGALVTASLAARSRAALAKDSLMKPHAALELSATASNLGRQGLAGRTLVEKKVQHPAQAQRAPSASYWAAWNFAHVFNS